MTGRPVIEQVFQLKGHHIRQFHISTPIVTGVGIDDLFASEPLHRHIMLSASADEHGRSARFHCTEM